MKKIIICFSLIFVLLLSNTNINYASEENHINNININITIDKNGDAFIEEEWNIVVNSGTEIYKVMKSLGESQIENFKVYDESGSKFKYMDIWDIGRSKSYKSYKCGVIQEGDHYELCFGIGNYGNRTYTFTYTITDFVKEYSDYQGIDINLLSDFTIPVEQFCIDLSSEYPITDDNSDIYGFGFEGTMTYDNNHIIIKSNSSFELGQQVHIITQFNESSYNDLLTYNEPLKTTIKNMKKSSEFSKDEYILENGYKSFIMKEDYSIIYLILFTTLLGIIGLAGLLSYNNYKNKLKEYIFNDHKKINNIKPIKTIPSDISLFEIYYLSKINDILLEEQQYNLIAAIILEWINTNKIQLNINSLNEYEISFIKGELSNELEESLFNYLKDAAGANLILEKDEFDKWYEENYEKIDKWLDDVYQYVEKSYKDKGILNSEEVKGKWLFKNVNVCRKVYDSSLRTDIIHIMGLKKYIEEELLNDETHTKELWNQYLVYINIFGLYEELYNQLDKQNKLKDFTQIRFSNTKIINILTHKE